MTVFTFVAERIQEGIHYKIAFVVIYLFDLFKILCLTKILKFSYRCFFS